MVNVAVIATWLIVVILLIVFMALIIYISTNTRDATNIQRTPLADCSASIEAVPNITGFSCCINSGITSSLRYVDTALNPSTGQNTTYDMVMGPSAVEYINLCAGFCPNGFDRPSMKCNGGEGQDNFDRCITQTKPVNCVGSALPLAQVNGILYYGQSATKSSCPNTGVCQ